MGEGGLGRKSSAESPSLSQGGTLRETAKGERGRELYPRSTT